MYFNFILQEFRRSLAQEIARFNLSSSQARMAFKTALSCVLAAVLAMWLETEHFYWAAVSALIVSQPHVGATFKKGVLRAVGTVAGGLFAIPLVAFVGFFVDSRLIMVAIIFIIAAASLEFSYGHPHGYAIMMAGLNAVVICIGTLADPTVVVDVVFFRSFEIVIGIVSAWLVHFLFLPRQAYDLFLDAMVENTKNLALFQNTCITHYLSGSADHALIRTKCHELNEAFKNADKLLAATAAEGVWSKKDFQRQTRLINALKNLTDSLAAVYRPMVNNQKPSYQKRYTLELSVLVRQFARLMTQIQCAIAPAADWRPVQRALAAYQATVDKTVCKYENMRPTNTNQAYALTDVLQFHFFLKSTIESAKLLQQAILPMEQAAMPAQHPKGAVVTGTNLQERYVLLAALSMAIIPLLWLSFDLPGISQISVSALIILQPDNIETERKGFLRLAGCLCGGSVGLLVLGTGLATGYWAWLTIVFGGIFFFAYLANGSAAHSYLGLQGALAFIVTLIQANGPAVSLAPPVQRLFAISMGASIILILTHVLIPESPQKRFETGLENCMRLLTRAIEALPRALEGHVCEMTLPADGLMAAASEAEHMLHILAQTGQSGDAAIENDEKKTMALKRIARDLNAFVPILNGAPLPVCDGVSIDIQRILATFAEDVSHALNLAPSEDNNFEKSAMRASKQLLADLQRIRDISRQHALLPLPLVLQISSCYILALELVEDVRALIDTDRSQQRP